MEHDHRLEKCEPSNRKTSAAQAEREAFAESRARETKEAVDAALGEERLRQLLPRLVAVQKTARMMWFRPKADITVAIKITGTGAQISRVRVPWDEDPLSVR